MNLDEVFGEGTISDIDFLPTGADKDEALAKYEGSGAWWIEDKVENAITGKKLGLNSIIIEHDYNKNDYTDDIPTAKFWSTVYKINHRRKICQQFMSKLLLNTKTT